LYYFKYSIAKIKEAVSQFNVVESIAVHIVKQDIILTHTLSLKFNIPNVKIIFGLCNWL
jgi:hypothetical protein